MRTRSRAVSILLPFTLLFLLLAPMACAADDAEMQVGDDAMSEEGMSEESMSEDGTADDAMSGMDDMDMDHSGEGSESDTDDASGSEMDDDAEMGGMPMGGTAPGEGGPVLSGTGDFQLSYRAETDPIQINQIHSWVIRLETAEGEPLENAQVTFKGDMPAHGHGLPTAPQVTEDLGNGEYRVEGIKFQMGGYWEIYVDFTTSDGRSDTIMMPLDLQ